MNIENPQQYNAEPFRVRDLDLSFYYLCKRGFPKSLRVHPIAILYIGIPRGAAQ